LFVVLLPFGLSLYGERQDNYTKHAARTNVSDLTACFVVFELWCCCFWFAFEFLCWFVLINLPQLV
jgi:hypothetical protein